MTRPMRRILLWFLTTVSAVVLLFGYRTSTSSALPDGTAAGTDAGAAAGSSTPRAAAPSTTTTTSGSATVLRAGQFTGSEADTRWGPVQTRITVANGRITAVDVVEYPTGNAKDREINADAVPTLVDETMQAQSAEIDMVSGATVTSTGYLESLQSALDQAHAA